MFCSECGATVSDDAKFCGECGAVQNSIEHVPKAQTEKIINKQNDLNQAQPNLSLKIIGSLLIVVSIIWGLWLGRAWIGYVDLYSSANLAGDVFGLIKREADNVKAELVVQTMFALLMLTIAIILAFTEFEKIKRRKLIFKQLVMEKKAGWGSWTTGRKAVHICLFYLPLFNFLWDRFFDSKLPSFISLIGALMFFLYCIYNNNEQKKLINERM